MLLILIGCDGAGGSPKAQEALLDASAEVTFGTVKELGPHRFQAEIVRTVTPTGGTPLVTREQINRAWQDERTWEYEASRDGKVRNHVIVFESVAWRATGERWTRAQDALSWEVMQSGVWDPWQIAFESLQDSLKLVPDSLEEIEGRRAWKQRVELVPAPEGRRKRPWTATVAEGAVWIDERSALRLVGDVHVVAESAGKSLDISLRFATAGIGMDARVKPPPVDAP
jgi:hypothetical protein